jgi:protein-L-isoaspartate(D-aspartate) O-methyltransferase
MIIVFMIRENQEAGLTAQRQQMLERDIKGRDINDSRVLKAMSEIRREEFVPDKYKTQAYADTPLPIGMGQTISQPYIVALMTQELQLDRNCEVLEIGTGCGYQTAVLSRLAKKVYTIEKICELSDSAQAILGTMGFDNIEFCIGDGSCGWPGQRNFGRIIITAAVPEIPKPLLDQLAEDGLIIAPVGSQGIQDLVVCEKTAGGLKERLLCGVRFVKLIGEYGFD